MNINCSSLDVDDESSDKKVDDAKGNKKKNQTNSNLVIFICDASGK
jgi:hypothetical protein